MKSTGEVMGISPRFGDAFAKACEASGTRLPLSGRAFLTVNPYDKAALIPIGRELADLGFALCATAGTSEALREAGVQTERVFKVNEGSPNAVDRMEAGEIQMVVNTPLGQRVAVRRGRDPRGRAAPLDSVPDDAVGGDGRGRGHPLAAGRGDRRGPAPGVPPRMTRARSAA